MRIEKRWILGPLMVLGLNVPGLLPVGCSSYDVSQDSKYVRAQELLVDGVTEQERAEYEMLVGELEQEQRAREHADRTRLEGARDSARPFVPAPLQPLVDPLGELGILAWFLVAERKNRKAIEELRARR